MLALLEAESVDRDLALEDPVAAFTAVVEDSEIVIRPMKESIGVG